VICSKDLFCTRLDLDFAALDSKNEQYYDAWLLKAHMLSILDQKFLHYPWASLKNHFLLRKKENFVVDFSDQA